LLVQREKLYERLRKKDSVSFIENYEKLEKNKVSL